MAAYTRIVAASGGDHLTLTAAITAASAGDTVLVKKGSYTETPDVSKAVKVDIEGGTSFSSTFIISAAAQVIFGNGCTVTGLMTISGADAYVKARNGLSTAGLVISGARAFHDGGGWGTLHDGGTARHGGQSTADDAIVQNSRFDKTPTSGNFDGVTMYNVNRNTLRMCKIDDSYRHGVSTGLDSLVEGCYIADAGGAGVSSESGIVSASPRGRILFNHIADSGKRGINVNETGDNSVFVGNVIQACTGDEFYITANNEDVVVVANRVFGTIDDDSGTSIVQYNDLGTATCTVTGTLQSAGATETDIVNGGKTLILTLANAVWQNITAAALATAFQTLLTGDQDGNSVGWDDVKVADLLVAGAFVRTDTVVTITLGASATYNIAAGETITLANLDGTVLASEHSITPDDVSYSITTV